MTPTENVHYDIAIIGMGIREVAHLTLEAIHVLKCCKRGYMVSPDQETVNKFRDSASTYLKLGESLPPLESLARVYQKDRLRTSNYDEASAIVLHAAENERPVAYLTPGNPVSFDSVAQAILTGAKKRNLRSTIIPGISSVDTVLVDLQQELAPGLQIYEASWFVGAEVRPDTRFFTLLIQTSVFGTNYPIIGREPRSNALSGLKEYLLQFCPQEHPIILVRSGSVWNEPPSIHTAPLCKLDSIPGAVQHGASMLIPPVDQPVLNWKFVEKMASRANLYSLYVDSQ